ncbi:uncharacterized protein LOC124497180 [Dermatophagoides farinae]|uniref:uncharacterized protein LOC124497180 n=1 Tax=Dermatophagoides farinae TaxID=6954 RepID=UPI001F10C533|nr:uncharacterized protein LOC124497180 [Dermatophagoides farinae]
MFQRKLFLLAIFSYMAIGQCAFKNNSLDCHRNILTEMDKHLRSMELVHGDQQFPESLEELKAHCGRNKKVIDLMSKMADKCMTGFTKNIMQVTIYSLRRSRKSICKNKPNKEMLALINAGKCVNGGRKRFSKCVKHAQIHIETVKDMPTKKRIPLICCEIVRAKSCMLDKAKDVNECSEQNVETLQRRFTHISANSMNMACGDYTEDSNRCDTVKPPEGLDYNRPPKSFMTTALELINLFENDPELQV